ncbi:DNA repair protein RecO [Bordetella genomosp. 10]|uniref:DNA repair protein RecO n=1 Tax=Bordetella genomosp. 10 TaxID=1416804 RepID=A0A261RZ98_9BORD|nr:DNA repair protein RecO [Bordetella genomosp. 10]OZI30419.1 DNA repair protein RecO [Bordetella genomosp. 10]
MSRRSPRVQDSPAYMLHATPWRETSLVIQAFSREFGCVAMVAKGAKRPYSVLRPVLSAFQPLSLSWTGAGEVKTLTRAEIAGVLPLAGGALMSAWYMNELLLRLMPREDAHPVLFDAYQTALTQLAAGSRAAAALRRFEWTLLRETGYGVDAEMPDFEDPAIEPALRRDLRERLAQNLAGRELATRRVLLDLQRLG